jgi:hypothetical protein
LTSDTDDVGRRQLANPTSPLSPPHDGKDVEAMEADKKPKTRRLDVSWVFGMFFLVSFNI